LCRLDPERLACQALERRGMARRGPELELRIAVCADLKEVVVSAIVQLDAAHDLRMAAIEAFCEPEDGGERPDRPPRSSPQLAEALMCALRRGLTMIARDERDRLDLFRLEPAQLAILDQVVRVLVVTLVTDVDANVVEN
jgi:hypothetical protein